MSIPFSRKSVVYAVIMGVMLCSLTLFLPHLAANLGLSTAAAKKTIDIIDKFSTAATIVSLLGILLGFGTISTALVIVAKKIISKYGKAYATTW